MRRASARSSTTTSARPRGRILAIEWPVAGLAAASAVALAFDDGGYFAPAWGWSALALFWIAGLALFLRDRFSLGRLELALLGSFAAFVAWVALSATWSSSTERSILDAQRDLVYLGGLLAVLLVARGRPVTELLVAVCGAALVTSAFALANFFFSAREAGSRLSEPLGYPNALGLVAAIGALLATAFAANARSQLRRALAAAGLVVFVLTIFFTYSRGTWISLAVGLAAMVVADPRRVALVRTAAAAAPVVGVAIWLAARTHEGFLLTLATVLLGAAAALATIAERRIAPGRAVSIAVTATLLALLLAVPAAALARYGSRPAHGHHPSRFSGRAPLWHQAWRDWEAHRALGSGAGMFELFWVAHRRTSANARDAHSLYLETLAEVGPVGLALLVATLALPFLVAPRARFHPFVPGALAAYLAFLVHAAGDWDWEMPAATLLGLFAASALVLAGRPETPRSLPRAVRAAALAGAAALALVGFAGLIGNGALDASARAAASERWPQSASQARKAIRWLPWSAEAWRQLAIAQSHEGDPAAAEASLRRAVAKSPDEWRPWVGLARLSTGRAQREALRQAARLNPRDPEVLQFRLAPGSLTQRWSYDDAWTGWPVAPLHRQHAVRASFLDPRAGTLRRGGEAAYHFGVDITVRDDRPEPGAPPGRTHRVYAIESGVAILPPRGASGPCEDRKVSIGHFDYWHVDTSGVVASGERIRPGQAIGWTCKGLWHVHLSEWMELYGRRVYVNPVHPGMKLAPYVDRESPVIHAIELYRPAMPGWTAGERVTLPQAGVRLSRTRLSGLVDVRAWIDDPPPRSGRLASATQPYRVALEVARARDGRPVLARTVFRADVFLGSSLGTQAVPIGYHYAPGTKETLPAAACLRARRARCGGTYWFRLFARPTSAYWDTRRTPNGSYLLRVRAWDAAGNEATRTARITIRNPPG
jgi:O-Antigen ligase/Tetratricopeptide repeat